MNTLFIVAERKQAKGMFFTSVLIPIVLFTRQATAFQKHWITGRRVQRRFNLVPVKEDRQVLSDLLPPLTHGELCLTSDPSCTVSSLRVTLSSKSKSGSRDLGDRQPIYEHTFMNTEQIKSFPWLFTFHLHGQGVAVGGWCGPAAQLTRNGEAAAE